MDGTGGRRTNWLRVSGGPNGLRQCKREHGRAGKTPGRMYEKRVSTCGGGVVGGDSGGSEGTAGGDDRIREFGRLRIADGEEQKRDDGSALPGIRGADGDDGISHPAGKGREAG